MTPPDGAHKRLLLRERAPWNLTKRARRWCGPNLQQPAAPSNSAPKYGVALGLDLRLWHIMADRYRFIPTQPLGSGRTNP